MHPSDLPPSPTFLSHAQDRTWRVTLDRPHLVVQPAIAQDGDPADARWQLIGTGDDLQLSAAPATRPVPPAMLLAALEAAFSHHPHARRLTLALPPAQLAPLATARLLTPGATPAAPQVWREALWQHPPLWLGADAASSYPLRYDISNGWRHPCRPAKPQGLVYQRFIPWLQQTLTFRTVDLERDLPVVNRWMNDPVVAHFWQEEGDLARHRAYLEALAGDPRVLPLIGCFDGDPFGYFEAYWAKEDRIAPFCDAQDFDRGWHALVGEARFRGAPWLTAWMPSMSHYLLLDDCRTQRLVIEPRADNDKMIRSLARCGYALLKEFDFPHKRALLGMLLRERFFSQALWIPRPTGASSPERPTTA